MTDDDAYAALPPVDEVRAIQAEGGFETIGQAVAEHRRRKGQGGRKRGAVNKRTADFQRWVLQFGQHPGKFLTEAYSRPTEQLAAELNCDKEKAFQMQIRAAETMLPYHESKMPVRADLTVNGDLQLDLGGFFDPRVTALAGDGGEQIDFIETAEFCEFEPVPKGGSE